MKMLCDPSQERFFGFWELGKVHGGIRLVSLRFKSRCTNRTSFTFFDGSLLWDTQHTSAVLGIQTVWELSPSFSTSTLHQLCIKLSWLQNCCRMHQLSTSIVAINCLNVNSIAKNWRNFLCLCQLCINFASILQSSVQFITASISAKLMQCQCKLDAKINASNCQMILNSQNSFLC